ncbi:MAG: bifunctional demethylmenaquinone methyltransferase/2-methoxy-6-polyprenyl-1,4-benzoquinol methylase UbiE [Candidatus Goldbacteria bacterium]|nr:bifunctional demethylmenaquinone methyltransferase/2-methoxy-6-polyprenyl-1,4-benzoquinol methylase UbiE [Candidatus Goldiibacteriota bacterium]
MNVDNIEKMFDGISSRYDKLNRIMSFGMDTSWRNKASGLINNGKEMKLADIAAGTCDQVISFYKSGIKIKSVTAVDFSAEMLEIGRKKLKNMPFETKIIKGNALNLPLYDNSFDGVCMSFGIRNIKEKQKVFCEIYRIMKPGSRMTVLELTVPENKFFRPLYFFYISQIVPLMGKIFSGDREAYEYLNQSIKNFPENEKILLMEKDAGFVNVRAISLSFGISTIFYGEKPSI